jgi:hypothetical protein
MITESDAPERNPQVTRLNWMISPGTKPRSAPEAERVTVNQDPGAWGLFVFPHADLPPSGTAFTDIWGVPALDWLLDVLRQHGQEGTWWFAKVPGPEGSRYLTITYRDTGEYELREAPSSARHPFILTSAAPAANHP